MSISPPIDTKIHRYLARTPPQKSRSTLRTFQPPPVFFFKAPQLPYLRGALRFNRLWALSPLRSQRIPSLSHSLLPHFPPPPSTPQPPTATSSSPTPWPPITDLTSQIVFPRPKTPRSTPLGVKTDKFQGVTRALGDFCRLGQPGTPAASSSPIT